MEGVRLLRDEARLRAPRVAWSKVTSSALTTPSETSSESSADSRGSNAPAMSAPEFAKLHGDGSAPA